MTLAHPAYGERRTLAQFGIISAFPLWAILVIVLNVVVIYQLVARWDAEV